MDWAGNILIVDHDSPWRSELTERFRQEPFDRFCVSDSAADLKAALVGPVRPRLLVVGHELMDGDAYDELYLASLARPQPAPGEANEPLVCLVTETRHDLELLGLWRRRGVDQFLYRDDPAETTFQNILRLFRSDGAKESTYGVSIEAQVRQGALSFGAVIEQISRERAQLVIRKENAPKRLAVGEWLGLTFTSAGVTVDCLGEILGVEQRKKTLFGRSQSVINIAFQGMSFDASRALLDLLNAVRLETAPLSAPAASLP